MDGHQPSKLFCVGSNPTRGNQLIQPTLKEKIKKPGTNSNIEQFLL